MTPVVGRETDCNACGGRDLELLQEQAGVRIQAEGVEATLRGFPSAPGPALLHARVDPACDVSPMLLSGQALDAMWRWNP